MGGQRWDGRVEMGDGRWAVNMFPWFRRSQFKQDMRTAIQHALLKGTADVANAAVARLCNRTADWIE